MYLITKKDLDVLKSKVMSIQDTIKNQGYKNLENPDKIYSIFSEIEKCCENINNILNADEDC